MKKTNIAVGLAAAFFALPPIAANAIGLSLDAGTPGLGLHLSVPLTDAANLRLGFNDYGKYDFTKFTERVKYDLKLNLRTFDVLIDWFPSETQFRLTGGIAYNRNTIGGIGLPRIRGAFDYDGDTYTVSQLGRLDGDISFRSISPYLGIGWGNAAAGDRGWRFTTDIGILFQGSPDVRLGTSQCTLPRAGCPLLATALESTIRNETVRLNEELKNYRFFPVIRFGLAYRF